MSNKAPDVTPVTIGPGDAALVFREGGVELYTPGLKEGLPVSKHVSEACSAGLLLRSPEPRFAALRAQLEELFEAACRESAGA